MANPVDRKGRYALVSPTPGGYHFWAINDLEQQYAVVAISADFDWAEEVIRSAWERIEG